MYAQESARLLDLRDISLTTVQACVLLGAYCISEGEAAAEAVYYSVACRIALLLRLADAPVGTILEREVNRRGAYTHILIILYSKAEMLSGAVWWSLCMIDVWCSAGVRLPRSIEVRDTTIPLPMEENLFLQLKPTDHSESGLTPVSEPSMSLLAQMVKLNSILMEVNELNKLAATNQSWDSRLAGMVESVSQKLDAWHDDLPNELKDTPANLALYASRGLGGMFVAVYLGYYHYGQLLYYQFLHEDCKDDSPHIQSFANKCKAHATALCEITYRAYSTPGCEVLYTMVGHVLVIASTVQLHILLFNTDEMQIRIARSRLEQNFEILTRLQSYWPTLDICFSRFQEFHKACQKSTETSFRLDRWMLRFLFEFANPVGEKESEEIPEVEPWSLESLGFNWTSEDEEVI